jgi:hypothetical protein
VSGLTQYIGTTAESKPTATPAMILPAIIIGMLRAPACRAQLRMEIQAPMKTVFFRPSRSGSQATESALGFAPPVKAETIPPVSELEGVPMYFVKYGCTMVEEMIPES